MTTRQYLCQQSGPPVEKSLVKAGLCKDLECPQINKNMFFVFRVLHAVYRLWKCHMSVHFVSYIHFWGIIQLNLRIQAYALYFTKSGFEHLWKIVPKYLPQILWHVPKLCKNIQGVKVSMQLKGLERRMLGMVPCIAKMHYCQRNIILDPLLKAHIRPSKVICPT
jgi:hypothetical protein